MKSNQNRPLTVSISPRSALHARANAGEFFYLFQTLLDGR
jgi:hypothetical protein